ncbi:MAG: hypothetical protein C0404_13585 [Verrucomicrobia bacterium]|nr:hypothetical protein [Verrucomicrobiota bacterium]
MSVPTYEKFRGDVLRFAERCGPGAGVFDEAEWEANGAGRVCDGKYKSCIVPPEKRQVRVLTLEERCRNNYWAFASTPGGVESIEGSHSAVTTLFFLGELEKLSADNRTAWVDYFNRFQDPDTGYFAGPYIPPADHRSWRNPGDCTHTWIHLHDHMVSSLCSVISVLGGKSKIPLSRGRMTGRFLDRSCLRDYLWGRDWNDYARDGNYRRHNPWYVGNEFWFPACILWQITRWEAGTPAAIQARKMLDEVWYDWHDRNFGVNGFWYGDLDGAPELLWRGNLKAGHHPAVPATADERYWLASAVMGGAHQLWFYNFDGHPIPDPVRRAQTDSMLALQNRHNRHFGMGDIDNPKGWSCNCTDIDCMTVLCMNFCNQDYRRDDCLRALHDSALAVLGERINADGVLQSTVGVPFSHAFNSVPTYSPADAGNMLDQSFYLWGVIAACEVLEGSDDPGLATFINRRWPQMPANFLWVPRHSS